MGHTDFSWMGGLNYLRTLIAAIQAVPQREIEPVLLCPPGVPETILASFPGTTQVVSAALAPTRARRLLRQASRFLTGVDRPLESVLKRQGIRLVSHSWHFDHSPEVRTIEWIPDLQHRHLPDFFPPEEVQARDRNYVKTAQRCSALVLSSRAALADLGELYAPALPKSHVLHFVAHPDAAAKRTPLDELKQRYAIDRPFFHLPNQFWAHKNHRVVIEALTILKGRGQVPLVLCTGLTKDGKRPEFFPGLMAEVKARGLEDSFRVLGLVPVPDLYGLMQHAAAVINPSHFEGWSSTVEEAKALGKTIVLSDLAVHREQDPARGLFFPADDAQALADRLRSVLDAYDAQAEAQGLDEAMRSHRQRFEALGQNYQHIALSVLS